MDVRYSTEQRALRDSAAQLVERLAPQSVAALDDGEREAKLDAAVAAAGWRELRAPQDDGTPWASGVEVAIVAEELGRGLADTAFVGPTLAAELRRLAGAPMATSIETVALTADLTSLASAEGDTLASGSIAIDAAGSRTALALLSVPGGHALGQVAVGASTTSVDLTRPAADLGRAPTVVAVADQARTIDSDALAQWTALALATTCADLVGTIRGAVELACDYAKERRQYGQPIGAFQAVQHLLADAFVAVEGSTSVTLHAAWAVDALTPRDAVAASAVAKAYCARAARPVCETAIQVHGGIGNTWECLAHVQLRRALLSIDMLGGAGASLARVLEHRHLEHRHLEHRHLGRHDTGGSRGLR